jgi:hypothetical protein
MNKGGLFIANIDQPCWEATRTGWLTTLVVFVTVIEPLSQDCELQGAARQRKPRESNLNWNFGFKVYKKKE